MLRPKPSAMMKSGVFFFSGVWSVVFLTPAEVRVERVVNVSDVLFLKAQPSLSFCEM